MTRTPPPPSQVNFTTTGRLATGRYLHAATLLPYGKVLIAGGRNDGSGPLASGKVHVVGVGGEEGSIASSEIHDPITGSFSVTGSMGARRMEHSATLIPGLAVLNCSRDALRSASGE